MMKKIPAVIALVLSVAVLPLLAQELPAADVLMQRVAKKLASTKHLGYKYHFEFREEGEPKPYEESADAILDLQPADGTSKFRFQFDTADRTTIYNGTERFSLDKKEKKLSVKNNPSFNMAGDILLHNSPIAMKFALPTLAADASIQKKVSLTRSGGRDQYVIEFSVPQGVISLSGEIIEAPPGGASNVYYLKVDKETLYPVEVLHTIGTDKAIFKTTYANVTDKPKMPGDRSWFFSSYEKEYALQKKKSLTLIEATKTAPEFSLPVPGSTEQVGLSRYKGKLILLEFWIVNCGFCFEAVPRLNRIYDTYHDKGLEVLSINMYDSPAAIEKIQKKSSPNYAGVTGGDSIAAAYGVDAYPAIVLIGEDGKVIYSSKGLDHKELENVISAHLNAKK